MPPPAPEPAMAAALLPLLLLLLHRAPELAAAVRFDYATLTLGSLRLLGDAHLKNGTIRLSHDLPVPTSGAGRALYATAVPVLAGFSTQFAFTVATLNPSSVGGGLAFVVSTDATSLGDAGAYIGVSTAADAAAVEFDTLMDVQFGDLNGNHVGLDLGSMVSAAAADLDEVGVELTSGRTVNAWIDYRPAKEKGGGGGILEVSVSYAAKRPPAPVLSAPLDLGESVKGAAFVGFSASTQGSTEVHAIEWWTFSTASPSPAQPAPPPEESPAAQPPQPSVNNNPPVLPSPLLPGTTAPPAATTVSASAPSISAAASAPAAAAGNSNAGSPRPPAHAAVAGAATAGAFVAASFAGFALWALARRARARRRTAVAAAVSTTGRRGGDGGLASAAALARSPREFSYKELSAATRGFDSTRVIGNGAFGTVYKGIVPDTGAMVAVKRCTNAGNGEQARSEFLSELSIIAGLRHRNLLRLQGWCYEKGEILLVYDYMRNGSLDRALFDAASPVLPWRHRRDILAGVASALAYLHHECERRVIHRDVKSSNVMLDDSFRARLGDFGLARQAEHGESPDATAAAGTMGYLAPEYLLTGSATEATDVFSFGALALEVACGRRPIGATGTEAGRWNNLVEWVWSLHGEARVVEAVDPRLGGEFEEGEVRRALLVGLACSSPEPGMRPGMRAVVQVLGGEADPPFVPAARPSMSFSANHQLLLSLQDSVSDYNALGLTLSEDSSEDSMSSSSLTSTLRRGGHDIGFSTTGGDAR
ncbi:unnamed protein product [Urochloa humidicola]